MNKLFTVVIFNKKFFALSETFIYRQVRLLSDSYNILLVGHERANAFNFPLYNIPFVKVLQKPLGVERWMYSLLKTLFKCKFLYTLQTRNILSKIFDGKNTIVHAHYGWNGIDLLPLCRKYNVPLVVSFHGNDASGWLNKRNYKNKLPELFNYASHIILCSHHMIQKLQLENYLKKVSVIPYGINLEEYKPYSVTKDSTFIKILHVGRLTPKKGVMDLIKVFSKLRAKHEKIILQIIGDGAERKECEKLVKDLNMQNDVLFYGGQPQMKVKEFMNGCDVFVLNSQTDQNGDMEGLPNVILEAMAFEKAVVSTRHAGIPTAINDGVDGFLVDEYDNTSLENALQRLIISDGLRIVLGKAARIRIMNDFSEKKISVSLGDVFQNVILEIPFQDRSTDRGD